VPLASIPEPGRDAWHFGPLPVRAYALCLVVAIAVAVLVARHRYRKAGGRQGIILDVAAWAIPFGLLGAFVHAVLIEVRHDFGGEHVLWHDVTAAVAAIGVPGAVALGALGAWIACRRAGVPLRPVAGAAAPGVAFGLAIGGLAHWWAQDFYGRPASWWLAERIGPTHRVTGYENYPTFQPAFLYQSAWDVAVGFAIIWAARRFALTGERVFMLGAAAYAAGGLWVESVRIGPQPRVFGLPYDVWGDVAVFVVAAIIFYLTRPRKTPPSRRYRVSSSPMAGDRPRNVIST
jgi:prolipoprotein diacylglyceryltransferase